MASPSLGRSAHTDTFTRDNLPPSQQWPDIPLDGFQYPEQLNIGVELTDRVVAQGFGDRVALIGNGRRRTYKELSDWTNRIARAQNLIHFLHHARFHGGVHAAQRRIEIRAHRLDFAPGGVALQPRVAHLNRMAQDRRSELLQQQLPERPRRYSRCRLSRRGALQNVSRIMKIELLRARQISVSRPRRGQMALRVIGAITVFHRQRFLPIFPVAVFNPQRDWRADRFSVAHAGKNVRLIFLDALPPAPAESQLPPVKLSRDQIHVHRDARGQPGNPRHERLPVRLSGGDESQHVQWCLARSNKQRILPDASVRVKERRAAVLSGSHSPRSKSNLE